MFSGAGICVWEKCGYITVAFEILLLENAAAVQKTGAHAFPPAAMGIAHLREMQGRGHAPPQGGEGENPPETLKDKKRTKSPRKTQSIRDRTEARRSKCHLKGSFERGFPKKPEPVIQEGRGF